MQEIHTTDEEQLRKRDSVPNYKHLEAESTQTYLHQFPGQKIAT